MIALLKSWFREEYHGSPLKTIEIYLTIFMFGSIFGWIYEEIFYFFANGCHFVLRGEFLGPWLPVYGAGAVFMALIIERLRNHPLLVFLASAAICGVVEYFTGYFLYHYMGGQKLWDYNTEPLNFGNIDGYVCLRSVLFFGVSGVMLIYVVNPAIRHFAMKLKPRTFALIAFVPVILFILGIIGHNILLHI